MNRTSYDTAGSGCVVELIERWCGDVPSNLLQPVLPRAVQWRPAGFCQMDSLGASVIKKLWHFDVTIYLPREPKETLELY